MTNLSVSIFGQITGYRIYTMSREPIKLLEIQYPVFGTVGLRIICTFARDQIAIASTCVLAICSRNDRILLATCSNFDRDLIASITCSRANLH